MLARCWVELDLRQTTDWLYWALARPSVGSDSRHAPDLYLLQPEGLFLNLSASLGQLKSFPRA